MTIIRFIGQSGIVISHRSESVVIDPYLSDSVALRYGAKFRRQVPIPNVSTWARTLKSILLTHAHLDHTDPVSIQLLLKHSPRAEIYGPFESRTVVQAQRWVPAAQIRSPSARWFKVASHISARTIPAAHVLCETDFDNLPRYVGYFLKVKGKLIYHAGDTSLHPKVLRSVKRVGHPDIAFIPVNERNYYREKQGIKGNLTVREALAFGQEMQAKRVIPIHWDMFCLNSTLPEEIQLIASKVAPDIDVKVLRCGQHIAI